MVSFRTRTDGQVFPVSGVASTSIIGAPVSKSLAESKEIVSTSKGTTTRSQLRPLDFPGQQPSKAGGGIFSPSYIVDRYVGAAKQKRDEFKRTKSDLEAGKKAKDFDIATQEAEPVRLEEVKERTSEIKKLKEVLSEIPKGRSKKDKAKTEEFREDLKETIEQAELDRKLIEQMNWQSSEQALKFAALQKGDKLAQKILEAIRKKDFKKARKLAEERAKQNAKLIAEQSRLASMEGKEILEIAGFTQNAQGQYIPTAETPEIASENLGTTITPEELAILQQTSIQAPPKLDTPEILLLAGTEKGEAKLREWGYLK
jgi:hypothetical protein